MDINNSSGRIGTYSNKDVYVVTREEFERMTCDSNSYYVIKDFPTVEGYPTLVQSDRIVGHCRNDGGIKIYNRYVPYTYRSTNTSADKEKEYTYTMKDAPQLNIEALAQKASELIKNGLATGNKLLKEEQERAQVLCCATHNG